MKLSISNIGWANEYDDCIYCIMRNHGFSGLEIAPTRVFSDQPYEKLDQAREWKSTLLSNYGLSVSSMQSIWYGHSERIFGSDRERLLLLEYTKKAIDFAAAVDCENLVFGCPKNRFIPINGDIEVAVHFFKQIGDYALKNNVVIAMEANPPTYNTNFLNTTKETARFIERVDSGGIMLNLDIGTMIENGENISSICEIGHLIHHVHISEPGLVPIRTRLLHKELAEFLKNINYQKYISIEVGKQGDIQRLSDMMAYAEEIFE